MARRVHELRAVVLADGEAVHQAARLTFETNSTGIMRTMFVLYSLGALRCAAL